MLIQYSITTIQCTVAWLAKSYRLSVLNHFSGSLHIISIAILYLSSDFLDTPHIVLPLVLLAISGRIFPI